MKRLLPCVALLALLLGFSFSPAAQAYPKPAVDRISWELDFTHGNPTRITVQGAADAAPKAYWYMTFTVTNKTSEEQMFLPEFDLVDGKGKLHRSDKNIPSAVFDAIKEREGKKLLEPLSKVSGKILVGPDQARDSVAIWPEPVERMGSFSIFVTGLSGEAVWYKDGKETPLKKADWVKVKPEEAGEVLRKTLALDYQIPGDEFYQGRDVVILKKEEWVMR